MSSKIASIVFSVLFEYDTSKIVHIKSKTVGIINRLVQLLIIAYIIGWVMVYKHGYQEFSSLTSSVTTKVKGAVYTEHPTLDIVATQYDRVWDVADYVVPPQENGAFFILTNAIITPNQTQGRISLPPENSTICSDNSTCIKGTISEDGNAVLTGECKKFNDTCYTCEGYSWIPLEDDTLQPPYDKRPLLKGTEEFTVLIKNSIGFKEWPTYKTRNISPTLTESYLKTCRYNVDTDPLCPIFKLGTIVKYTNTDYTKLTTLGGVIGIIIHWDCNLDFNVKNCIPRYEFRRLDDPDAKIAKGWNFRFAHFYNDTLRTLYKAYGVLFIVIVEGQGRMFNMVPLMLNVGSGLALLSIAVVVCDVIVLYCMRKRSYYREKKYLLVNDESDQSQIIKHDELDAQYQDY